MDFNSRISTRQHVYFRQMICRLGRFSLWISATEFPPDDDNPKLSVRCFYDSVRHFTLPAFVALLLTRWRVACTTRDWRPHHVWECCSPMVREEFICHIESHMQVRPPGTIDFRADSSLSPPPSQLQPPPERLCSNDSSMCSSWTQCGN